MAGKYPKGLKMRASGSGLGPSKSAKSLISTPLQRGLEIGHFEEQFSWVAPHPACGHPLPKGEGEIHALER